MPKDTDRPVDLSTAQPDVVRDQPRAARPRRVGIEQLLEQLVASGRERAAGCQDPDEKKKYRDVARLARELIAALDEVGRPDDGAAPE